MDLEVTALSAEERIARLVENVAALTRDPESKRETVAELTARQDILLGQLREVAGGGCSCRSWSDRGKAEKCVGGCPEAKARTLLRDFSPDGARRNEPGLENLPGQEV